MSDLSAFLFGFLASMIGVFPPGLLNMSAAKISINDGKIRATIFALGACTVVLFQTYLAILFAKFIDNNPSIINILREIGLFVFTLLTIYFFWTSKKFKPKSNIVKLKSKRKRYFLGVLLSALNLFPIPYYVFVSVTLASFRYFDFQTSYILYFVIGSGLGALFMFGCYIQFFNKFGTKESFFIRNINYIIGTMTGLGSIITLFHVIIYYTK